MHVNRTSNVHLAFPKTGQSSYCTTNKDPLNRKPDTYECYCPRLVCKVFLHRVPQMDVRIPVRTVNFERGVGFLGVGTGELTLNSLNPEP